ncbi:MAG: TRAP transporter large permease subunit, partial [Sneathiella sp.]|nr:TRAP transporter large permease subunit [Sneathiella sp.]
MAEFLEIPYSDVVMAAAFPAFLYFFTLFLQVDLEAANQGVKRIDEADILPIRQVLATGWHFPVPFVVLIVALFKFNLSPAASVLLATAVLLCTSFLIGYKGSKMKLGDLMTALAKTGQGVTDLILICAGAGIVIGVLNLSGLGFGLTLSLVDLGGGNIIFLLIIAAVISVILGMGMPTVGVYVLLATLVAPALVEVGVEPIAAHMFVLYFGMMSMITPPVALAA